MHSETPQILPRKPGEPGGEKARELVRAICSSMEKPPAGEYGEDWKDALRDVLAGALAACALAEAKWWEHRLSALNAFDCRESRQVMELIRAMDTLRRDAMERMDTMERGGTER